MNYRFPIIENIKDVLPALEGEGGEAFGVMERGPFTIINYHYQDQLTFAGPHEAMRRECRGLVFDRDTGDLLNRRFHKFFNIGEKADTLELQLPWHDIGVVMQKLDGSMISPVKVGDGFRWISKMGFTDTAKRAEKHAAQCIQYSLLARELILGHDATPIFEWCSRSDRIVIDHPQDRLVLLAIRDNKLGFYWKRKDVENVGAHFRIPTVMTFEAFGFQALEEVRKNVNTEGFVIQFGNGHMVKIKTDWYVSIHKAKELLGSPRRVVENAINGTLDDLLAILPPDDQKRVEQDAAEFWRAFNNRLQVNQIKLRAIKAQYDRKTFAVEMAAKMEYPSVFFTCWDDEAKMRDAMLTCVKKAIGSDKRFELTMPLLLGDIKWTTGLQSLSLDA